MMTHQNKGVHCIGLHHIDHRWLTFLRSGSNFDHYFLDLARGSLYLIEERIKKVTSNTSRNVFVRPLAAITFRMLVSLGGGGEGVLRICLKTVQVPYS